MYNESEVYHRYTSVYTTNVHVTMDEWEKERERERGEEKKREETNGGERWRGIGIGRRAGDHHQVKSSRNAPANNLKFKLRVGLQI